MIKEFFKLPPAFQLNLFFFSIILILVLTLYYKVPFWTNFCIIFSSMILFQYFLCKIAENRFINIIKNIGFPVFSVLIAFDTVGELIPIINPKDIDHILLELDYRILGFYPYLSFQKIESPILTELMQISYCVYYILPFVVGFHFIFKRDIIGFHNALFLILLCYYLSYIGYILFPALGPRYHIPELFSSELRGIFFAETINNFLNNLEGLKRDAFPSGHVAISLVVLYIFWKNTKKTFYIFSLPVTLLIISTLYCRYHYFVDILGGILLTVVTLLLGNLYYNFWLNRNGNSFNKR